MAFGITSCKIYPLEQEDTMRRACLHAAEVNLTAANTDTALALKTLAAADSDGAYLNTLLARADRIVAAYIEGMAQVSGKGALVKYDSAASSGGAATEQLTVTGLAVADEILSVTQKVKGANGTALIAWTDGSRTVNKLDVEWTANPGANAVVRVLARKATGVPLGAGEYIFDGAVADPAFTFAGGGSTPTTLKLFLLVKLLPGMPYVKSVLTE